MTQEEALHILKTGANVFLTGAAGSGKTFVLREYIRYLEEHGVTVGITASTGIAATHMGGMTIHSWAGIGIADAFSQHEIEELAEQPRLRRRFEATGVLIIDEISMLHDFRLDLVDSVLRGLRGNDEPFGGIQVVLCGDFFQLPPVSRPGERETKFAYHAQSWRDANLQICYLHEQHRQSDGQYTGLLNAIRSNEVSEGEYELLRSRHKKVLPPGEVVTRLHAHNNNVDTENEKELAKLPGKAVSYEMTSSGARPLVMALQKNCLAPEVLTLKVGARVMFVKNNHDQGYVNGTLGTVKRCEQDLIVVETISGKLIVVEPESWKIDEDGKTKAEIKQYPLRLAWAITVHKSQGMSLDAAVVDLGRSFAPGMGYVALSRVRSLEGLSLIGMNDMALRINPEVLEIDERFRDQSAQHVAALQRISPSEIRRQQEEFLERVAPSGGVKQKKSERGDTVIQTHELVLQKISLDDMAAARGVKNETILSHLEQIRSNDPSIDLEYLRERIPTSRFNKIKEMFQRVGKNEAGQYSLSPVRQRLGDDYSYEELRIVRLFL